ncbi:cytochrome oxidase putative small subunit CydP [Legionella adelaidensis]|uniref:cytochrome oxidase putative small subunit CydP n=1 Tax=Legionella adelaidensis TaxID=45056 RepID=UPI0010413621|nr:cytochrome oxidase putative small subunit CydP [Legionella adelaidensis]
MRTIGVEISVTLIIKCILLFILWWVCFKGESKRHVSPTAWLLSTNQYVTPPTQDKVMYDSRK